MLAAITLSLADFGVLGALIAAQIGILGAFLRSHAARQERDLISLREQIEGYGQTQVRDADSLRRRIELIERDKADKESTVRDSVSTRAKIDHVAERIERLGGQIESQQSLAGAMLTLARNIERKHGDERHGS